LLTAAESSAPFSLLLSLSSVLVVAGSYASVILALRRDKCTKQLFCFSVMNEPLMHAFTYFCNTIAKILKE
jgi:hypothetical protein